MSAIHLIRHGQASFGADDYDLLSALGERQARLLGESLAGISGRVAVAASGAWRDGVFVAELRLVETPHTVVVELDPAVGTARLNWRLVPLTGADPLSLAAFPF